MKKIRNVMAAAALMLSELVAGAQPSTVNPATIGASGVSSASPMADGEVRKIDKAQGKLTLRHGPIAHLDMQAMTMVFKVADPKLLEGIQVGDKVRFAADKVEGVLTVTAIEAAR